MENNTPKCSKCFTIVYRNAFSKRSDKLDTMVFNVPNIENALFSFAQIHDNSTSSVNCVLSGCFGFANMEDEVLLDFSKSGIVESFPFRSSDESL